MAPTITSLSRPAIGQGGAASVIVTGTAANKTWQDKDGQTKYTTEVLANTVQFLGGNAQQGAGQGAGNYGSAGYGAQSGSQSNSFGGGNAPMAMDASQVAEPSFTEDDIPF